MAIGGAIGIAATVGTSYANKVSPWTGKSLTSNNKNVTNWNYGDHKSEAKWKS